MRLDQTYLARPYANALYSIAKTPEGIECWIVHLSGLLEILKNSDVSSFLKHPSRSPLDKKELLKSMWGHFVKDLPSVEAFRFIDLLVDNNRLSIIPELINVLKRLKDNSQGLHKAIVEGSYPISSDEELKIKIWLEKQIGKKVYIEYHINPSLLSGIKAQVGDECVYASTEHLLQRLAETLKHG